MRRENDFSVISGNLIKDSRLEEFERELEVDVPLSEKMRNALITVVMLGLVKVLDPVLTNFVRNEQAHGRRIRRK